MYKNHPEVRDVLGKNYPAPAPDNCFMVWWITISYLWYGNGDRDNDYLGHMHKLRNDWWRTERAFPPVVSRFFGGQPQLGNITLGFPCSLRFPFGWSFYQI